jgi:hypothetical protein
MRIYEMNDNMEAKLAVYGALQRLLCKINEKYPYISDEMIPNRSDDFSVPEQFYFVIGLCPEIMRDETDYTKFSPELGNTLLSTLLEEV